MRIAGLVRTSTVDYPGLIAAVVFTPGCNLDCFYCHNRFLLGSEAPVLEAADIWQYLRKRQGLLDGVVISGGEPLLQTGLKTFLTGLRSLGYRIKLDTNGTRPDHLADLLREHLLDYVAVDYKAPWPRYPSICGGAPDATQRVQATIELLAQTDIAWEARTTVIPQLSPEDLLDMSRAVPSLPAWYLQVYRRPEQGRPEDRFRLEAAAYNNNDLQIMAAALRAYQAVVSVRG